MKQLLIWQFYLGLLLGYFFLGRLVDFLRMKLSSV